MNSAPPNPVESARSVDPAANRDDADGSIDPDFNNDPDRPWEQLQRLSESGNAAELASWIAAMSVPEQIYALGHLAAADNAHILELLPPEEAAELISHLAESQAARTIGELDAGVAASIVHELPSDEQADLLGDLDDDHAAAIIQALPADDVDTIRQLTAYDDDVAGGLMICEILRFKTSDTVGGVLRQLASAINDHSDYDVRYGYVCDDVGCLVGVLPMRDLLFHKRAEIVADLMIPDPISVSDQTPLSELIDFFESHAYLGVPVVDETGILRGIVLRESVDYEHVRTAESDYLKSQGIVGGEELRTMPLWTRTSRRLSWLSINIVLNIGAASVIALFQDTLQSVIALAVFLPIISDMSGCSGNQAVAVSMRELSLGLIRPHEVMRVWLKEVSVGLINGTALGILVALMATFFYGNPYLGLVVGVALFANTTIAVSIGGTVPLLMKRFGFDPAVASGPLLTTVTDMCGFFLVLGLATLMLSKLV